MASFGKLTEYFSLRKSRTELRSGRRSRRSGSYCCSVTECRSLDRKPQRPLLGKSRTLPSIPQSPVLSRLPLLDSAAYREEMPEQKPYKKHSSSDHQKGCTVPSAACWALLKQSLCATVKQLTGSTIGASLLGIMPMEGKEAERKQLDFSLDQDHGINSPNTHGDVLGEAWRLEDDCTDPPRDPQLSTAVEDAPFSYFRTRSFYMRKSLSVDNHLGTLSYAVHPAETKAERVKTKLRRQFVFLFLGMTSPETPPVPDSHCSDVGEPESVQKLPQSSTSPRGVDILVWVIGASRHWACAWGEQGRGDAEDGMAMMATVLKRQQGNVLMREEGGSC
ncbi:hypothetical protein Q9966_002647 [Columba livia]|nr:hypothetical protein Q9966_002647 [Columba livia]